MPDAPLTDRDKARGFTVLLVAIVVAAILFRMGHATPEEQAAVAARATDSDFLLHAEMLVEAQLRDPKSADFREARVLHHATGTAVCGEVNAKNGFGGYTGFSPYIVTATGLVMRSPKNAARFAKLWRRLCTDSVTWQPVYP